VGIFADSEYEQKTIQLNEGDIFVAYTDGIVESINEYGEEYGENRLIRLIQKNRSSSAEEIKEVIVKSVLDWAFAEERDDDMTLIIGKIIKEGAVRADIES
jgi:sigma-B regulation protein RsbU (phosphoserine phosphatase)